MEVAMYRKKPVTVRATRWDGTPEEGERIVSWINGQSGDAHLRDAAWLEEQGIDPSQLISVPGLTHTISIATLEGDMFVSPGDWVIQGVAGEFYPCKNEIFEVSYTSVSAA